MAAGAGVPPKVTPPVVAVGGLSAPPVAGAGVPPKENPPVVVVGGGLFAPGVTGAGVVDPKLKAPGPGGGLDEDESLLLAPVPKENAVEAEPLL